MGELSELTQRFRVFHDAVIDHLEILCHEEIGEIVNTTKIIVTLRARDCCSPENQVFRVTLTLNHVTKFVLQEGDWSNRLVCEMHFIAREDVYVLTDAYIDDGDAPESGEMYIQFNNLDWRIEKIN